MVDSISQFLTSGSKLTDAIELFGTDIEFANLSVTTILITLLTAAVCGAVIYLVYRFFNRSVIYNENFNILVILTTVVTSFIIMTISSNVVLSLGMVGALSIVRFRTAIKEPVEIVFLFWALAAGIVVGAGMIPLAVVGSAIIGVILLVFANRKVRNDPYILVLSCADEAAGRRAMQLLEQQVAHCTVKSMTVNESGVELTAEVRTKKDGSTGVVGAVAALPEVRSATLVSYNGAYLG